MSSGKGSIILACFQVDLVVKMADRPNVVQQKLRLIELMRENAWMVDKSDPKYKTGTRRRRSGRRLLLYYGKRVSDLICPDSKGQMNFSPSEG